MVRPPGLGCDHMVFPLSLNVTFISKKPHLNEQQGENHGKGGMYVCLLISHSGQIIVLAHLLLQATK